jgi:hypothetical protein
MQRCQIKTRVPLKPARLRTVGTVAPVVLLVRADTVAGLHGGRTGGQPSMLGLTVKAVTSKTFWQALHAVALLAAGCI